MNMRPTGTTNSSFTQPTDKRIGDAFPIVEEVYKHLDQLKYLAENSDKLIGKQIEFRANEELQAIQWRYTGQDDWVTLLTYAELVGVDLTQVEETLNQIIDNGVAKLTENFQPFAREALKTSLLVFDNYATASAAAPLLPDGQLLEVLVGQDKRTQRYIKQLGQLVPDASPYFALGDVGAITRSWHEKQEDFVSIKDFGAIGDGTLHPLSERFPTLALAQVAYPHATSLSQSIDWAATQAAIDSGRSSVHAPAGHYMMTDTVVHKPGVTVWGDGVDLFIQSIPQEGSWRWSDERGTHFYFVGTGAKSYTMDIISNTQPVQTIGGVVCDFLHFTNQDSVAGAPATAKPFSVAWLATNNCGLRDCRIIPNHGNGLDGYLTRSGVLSDEWDIGVWAKTPQEASFYNVQCVGHWRMAAWLQTESPTGDTQWNTSERARYEKCVGVGVRGLAIRHHPVYWITSNTTDSVTIKWVPSLTVTRFPKIRTSQGLHTYGGYTFDAGAQTVTLTGVSPAISGNLSGTQLRSGYSGNNLSNSVFQDCVFSPFDYGPTMPTTYFGLPAGFAAEFDGFPLRNPVFINTVFQTRWDVGNTLWGACHDFKYIGCKHENGLLIANDVDIAGPLHANNLRFIAEDGIWYDTQISYFKPRSAIVDSYQNNQQGTSGEFFQRPMPGKRLVLQNQASQEVLTTSATDGLVTLWNGAHTARIELPDDGVGRVRMDILRFLNAAGTEVGRVTGSAATPVWELKGNTIITGYCRTSTDNVSNLGGSANRWADGYITRIRPGSGNPIWTSGTGTPEGALAAPVGSLYTRTDGGAGTTLYVKESGTGSTGWVAK